MVAASGCCVGSSGGQQDRPVRWLRGLVGVGDSTMTGHRGNDGSGAEPISERPAGAVGAEHARRRR